MFSFWAQPYRQKLQALPAPHRFGTMWSAFQFPQGNLYDENQFERHGRLLNIYRPQNAKVWFCTPSVLCLPDAVKSVFPPKSCSVPAGLKHKGAACISWRHNIDLLHLVSSVNVPGSFSPPVVCLHADLLSSGTIHLPSGVAWDLLTVHTCVLCMRQGLPAAFANAAFGTFLDQNCSGPFTTEACQTVLRLITILSDSYIQYEDEAMSRQLNTIFGRFWGTSPEEGLLSQVRWELLRYLQKVMVPAVRFHTLEPSLVSEVSCANLT